ncbi:MAG: hypothetical protein JWR44_3432 [Hymenobacter sp.]|jgi:hypothetical protein|nr:hypothetical protein [Hymenobacter sp.]
MNSPSSPAGHGRHHASHAANEAAWTISADTRQCAQEADASMARDEWKYAAPTPANPALPVAESKYFLL